MPLMNFIHTMTFIQEVLCRKLHYTCAIVHSNVTHLVGLSVDCVGWTSLVVQTVRSSCFVSISASKPIQ